MTGDTALASDEHPTLQCKTVGNAGLTTSLDGPQLYYSWSVTKDQWYKLTLSPADIYLYLYFFSSGACTASAIGADCQSGGVSGAVTAGAASFGSTVSMSFTPTTAGTYRIAVDSFEAGSFGGFKLRAEEVP